VAKLRITDFADAEQKNERIINGNRKEKKGKNDEHQFFKFIFLVSIKNEKTSLLVRT
jgi:hypothetical protein